MLCSDKILLMVKYDDQNIVSNNFTDEVKILMSSEKRQIQKCDDIYRLGFRNNGVYTLFTGDSFIKAYCELKSLGNNWLVNTYYMTGVI